MYWKYFFGILAIAWAVMAIVWAVVVFWMAVTNHQLSNSALGITLACICMLICIVGWRLESKNGW